MSAVASGRKTVADLRSPIAEVERVLSGEDRWAVALADALTLLPQMPECSVDAVVVDPPYGLSKEPDFAEVLRHWLDDTEYQHRGGGFMGRQWDSFVLGPCYWRECLRVLKPGGHLLAFGGTRTFDMQTVAIRLAGFEIRDRILVMGADGEVIAEPHPTELAWVYGSG